MAVIVESITAILQEQVTEAVRLGNDKIERTGNDEGDQHTGRESSVLQLEVKIAGR